MKRIFVFTLFSVLFLLNGCSSYEIVSKVPETPIIIDGNNSEWKGKLFYLEEESAAVGIYNDNDFLYICFATGDKANIIKIIRMGFTIWFEPEEGKTIGFQFPLKIKNPRPIPTRNSGMNTLQLKMLIKKALKENPEYRIVNENSFPLGTYTLNENPNIQIGIDFENSNLVYELKIPLDASKNRYNTVQSKPGEDLTIRFESGEFTKKDFSAGMPRNGFSERGGLSRRRGGSARIGNRAPGGDFQSIKDKIDFEINVALAK